MEKCKLKRCEFAVNGQCCLVCPKGLYRVDPKEVERRKIERCIRMLERVKRRLPNENRHGLPRGICPNGDGYIVSIRANEKMHTLGPIRELGEAMDVRADALEAKENGNFDAWLREFKAKYISPKKGKKTVKKGASKNAEKTE